MIQARDPTLVGTPFFARFNPAASWLTDLEPAFTERFPFEPARYEPARYEPARYEPARYEPARYEPVPDELAGL